MGNFLQWMKNGEGQEFFNNGDKYQGNYLNGMPHGYGEYIWSSGALFQGYFKEGLRYGKGIWRRSEESPTDSYQGHYEEDKKNGFGVYKWANGNVYKGQFMNDFKHGYGEMIYFDGQVIKGNWEQGRLVTVRIQIEQKFKTSIIIKQGLNPLKKQKMIIIIKLKQLMKQIKWQQIQMKIESFQKSQKQLSSQIFNTLQIVRRKSIFFILRYMRIRNNQQIVILQHNKLIEQKNQLVSNSTQRKDNQVRVKNVQKHLSQLNKQS